MIDSGRPDRVSFLGRIRRFPSRNALKKLVNRLELGKNVLPLRFGKRAFADDLLDCPNYRAIHGANFGCIQKISLKPGEA